MRVLVIGNLSDKKCGFANYSEQTVTALQRAGHSVTAWDGTYSVVYARREANTLRHYFLPDDAAEYDVIHTIWHPATLNHYAGCEWPVGPVLSLWNGCPQASCPFAASQSIRWSVLEEQLHDHRWGFYAIPDWITDLPAPDPAFTVGWSGIRGDGLGELTEVCAANGWATNFSQPGAWFSLEDEVRRLARSTVNVCWYGAGNNDRSGAVAMCLASRRPQLINRVPMFAHLKDQIDLYHANDEHVPLGEALRAIETEWQAGTLRHPRQTLQAFGWPALVRRLEDGWQRVKDGRPIYKGAR